MLQEVAALGLSVTTNLREYVPASFRTESQCAVACGRGFCERLVLEQGSNGDSYGTGGIV